MEFFKGCLINKVLRTALCFAIYMIHKKLIRNGHFLVVSQNWFNQFIKEIFDTEKGKISREAVFALKENNTFLAFFPAIRVYVWG